LNASEQKLHRTVTASLDARVSDLEVLVPQWLSDLRCEMRYADQAQSENMREKCEWLRLRGADANEKLERGFWGRLRWLLTGR
jgi:hypothetical protein